MPKSQLPIFEENANKVLLVPINGFLQKSSFVPHTAPTHLARCEIRVLRYLHRFHWNAAHHLDKIFFSIMKIHQPFQLVKFHIVRNFRELLQNHQHLMTLVDLCKFNWRTRILMTISFGSGVNPETSLSEFFWTMSICQE